ncbi:adenylate/guanylate cyclase domain-containing protein [Candidatus Pacearchaeota archaeon]|nr:adenylate/guanylate cyclase domain-containing protein [Candidatus Pacearchaeota archaeon]
MRDSPINEVTFVEGYTSCCVGIVDIVNSTGITAKLVNGQLCKYYSIFLNTMADIARDFGAKVVKNIGDSLLYYFPETSHTENKTAFRNVLECSLTMINHHTTLNQKMYNEDLPDVNYRISADYGNILIANSFNSSNEDVFGPTVNLCAKINSIAKPNRIVIGGDLYLNVKNLEEYDFNLIKTYSSGLKLEYPVYSIIRSKPRQWF